MSKRGILYEKLVHILSFFPSNKMTEDFFNETFLVADRMGDELSEESVEHIDSEGVQLDNGTFMSWLDIPTDELEFIVDRMRSAWEDSPKAELIKKYYPNIYDIPLTDVSASDVQALPTLSTEQQPYSGFAFEEDWKVIQSYDRSNLLPLNELKRQIAMYGLIAELWHLDDVKMRAKKFAEGNDNIPSELTDQQAWDILKLVHSRHDCESGISWDNIDSHIEQYFDGE